MALSLISVLLRTMILTVRLWPVKTQTSLMVLKEIIPQEISPTIHPEAQTINLLQGTNVTSTRAVTEAGGCPLVRLPTLIRMATQVLALSTQP